MTDLDHIQAFFERHCARLPDPVGMRVYAEHLAAGTSLQKLEEAIAGSEEARRVTIWRRITGKRAPENENDRMMLNSIVLSEAVAESASLPSPAGLSESALFVTSVYLAVLGRRPDDSGLMSYQQAISNGLPLLQVVRDVLLSEESIRLNGHCAALKREKSLRRWAGLRPLTRLCNGLANALVAKEYIRLWNKRIRRTPQ